MRRRRRLPTSGAAGLGWPPLFAQRGFVIHTVVVPAVELDHAERVTVRLVGLVAAGNPPG